MLRLGNIRNEIDIVQFYRGIGTCNSAIGIHRQFATLTSV